MTQQRTKTVATLAEINLYLQRLGLPPLKSLREITETTPQAYLAELKARYAQARRLPTWLSEAGEMWRQNRFPWQPPRVEGGQVVPWGKEMTTGQWTPFSTAGVPIGKLPTPAPETAVAEQPGATTITWTPGTPSQPGVPFTPGVAPAGQPQFITDPNYPGWRYDSGTGIWEYIGTPQEQEQAGRAGLGVAPTWAEQAGLAQREQELAWGKEQWRLEQAWREKQAAAEPELERKRFELQWEIDRQRLLSGLPSDDWITQWVVKNQPNPYKKTEPDPVSAVEQELDASTGRVQALEQIAVSRGMATGWDSPETQKATAEMEEAQKQRDTIYKAWKTVGDEKRDWTPQPYPNAPEWLPKYAPGQVAGRMISPENVVTPSGQQLTQMPRSTASKLGYFADWTEKMGGGRPWRDILAEAEISQPRTPSFGRSRWTPVGR